MLSKYNKSNLQVLVIGAGQIGSALDFSNERKEFPQSHIGAFLLHQKVNDVSLVELNDSKRSEAQKQWALLNRTYSSLEKVEKGIYDIACICTPSESRFELIEMCISKGIMNIICEKPLALTSQEAERISKLIKKSEANLLINFVRMFTSGAQKLKQIIDSKKLGALQSGHCLYGKGVINNGSHLLNFLFYLFDEVQVSNFVGVTQDDRFSTKDPTLSFSIRTNQNSMIFVEGLNYLNYSLFEIDLYFERGRITVRDDLVIISEVQEHEFFRGYKCLTPVEQFPLGIQTSMKEMADMAIDCFAKKQNFEFLKIDIDTSIVILKMCESLINVSRE